METFCQSSGSKISDALDAHDYYLETLNNWHDWLEAGGQDNNALKLMLFKLINDTIRKREPGGVWADIDEDSIPTADTLKDYVNSGRYNSFKTVIEIKRRAVEEAAYQLIEIINSPDFLAEIEALPYDEQLLYANKLADQFHSCNVGLLFQIQSINEAPVTPLPIFHPDRLTNKEGDFFTEHFPMMRRAGKVYAGYYMKLIPVLMADYNIERFTTLTLTLLTKYFRPLDLPNIERAYHDIVEFEKLLIHVRDFHKGNPSYLKKFGQPSAGALMIIVEVGNLYIALDKMREDPNVRSTFGLLASLAKVRLALSSAQEALGLSSALKLAPRRAALLSVVTAVYDVTIRAIDTHEAWRTGDLSVAAGHALEGVGIAAAALITALAAAESVAPSITINPLAGAFLTLGALVVTFGGTMLVAYTRNAPIEQWFENNYFGHLWNNVEMDEDPGSIMFRWRSTDGSANLARQVSDYLSMFYPLTMTLERGQQEPRLVTVKIEPILAYHESHVFVKRIYDGGIFSDPPRYTLIPVYMAPLNTSQDLFPDGSRRNIFYPLDPGPEQRLEEWFRVSGPLNFSTNPNFDPAGSFLEVEVTIPDKLELSLATEIEAHPDLMDNFTLVYRSRRQIV